MAKDNQFGTPCDCPDGGRVVYCPKDAASHHASTRLAQRGSECDRAATIVHCNFPHNAEIVRCFILDDEPSARAAAKQ